MDLPLDPPPTTELMAPAAPAPAHSAHAANPSPTHSPVHSHPPYAEMITAAISALKERNGSSKRAVAKYIETHYLNLPPTHSALMTHHLKRLKNNGQILMVKHSYKLPRSALATPVSANGAVSDPDSSVGPKKRPGRPPKPKSVQAAVPVFVQQPVPMNAAPDGFPGAGQPQNTAIGPLGSVYVAVGQDSGPAMGGTTRGPGRPPKRGGAKRGPGRPLRSGGVQTGVWRGRGRPKKNAAAPLAAGVKGLGRPRGRPPKVNNVEREAAVACGGMLGSAAVGVVTGGALPVASSGIAPVAGKRRGRPPKAGGVAKKPRKLGGKPLGRPKKNALSVVTQAPDNQLLTAFFDLKGKLEYFQSRIKQTLSVIKPHLNSETAVAALQELETLATMDVSPPSNVHPQS